MKRRILLVCLCANAAFAQLALDQKLSDFQNLAGLYAKNYGPADWKLTALGVDLFNLKPWLDKVRATKNDLEFYDVMIEYVASLDDAHDGYSVPSGFAARLNFTVDLYDGKPIVDFINRTRLPANEFPFQIGYELVSIDGKDAGQLITEYMKYGVAANPRSTRRFAASYLTARFQSVIPFAPEVGEIATVVFRHPRGVLETYRIPWTKTGLPLTAVGPVPTPSSVAPDSSFAKTRLSVAERFPGAPDYMLPLLELQLCELPIRPSVREQAVLNFGGRSPIFAMPDDFVQRLGRVANDVYFSGTFEAGGYRIGFIRIPSFAPSDLNLAVNQFANEILFMQANTDGLILDDMRNPGGFVSLVNTLASWVIPYRHRTLGFELRATSNWVAQISSALESARAQGAPQWVIDLLGSIYNAIATANSEFRGTTGPLPLDDVTLDRDPPMLPDGRVLAYSKPLMVLVDELSASGGDAFPATIQDNKRGLI
ncbi:MAG: PDZ domain-containing protein, partial [Candidatus Solibacter usitatus]|nr:PDZ domain-containing protein [Candidatus Solibacter usitatus]